MTATIAASDSVTPCQAPSADPEDWFAFAGTDEATAAKAACMLCPIYHQCAEYALSAGIPYGIWGGMDERERERAWKRNGGKPSSFIDDIDRALVGTSFYQARSDNRRDRRPFTSGLSVSGAA